MNSQTENRAQTASASSQQLTGIIEILLHNTARMLEMQTTTVCAVFEAQSRALTLLGAPDWSPLFRQNSSEASRLFTAGAQHTLNLARQTNEMIAEAQRRAGEVVQSQATRLNDEMRQSIDEMTQRMQESLRQWRDTAKHGIDEVQRMSDIAAQSETEQRHTVVVSELQGSTPQQAREQERGKSVKRPA